MCMRCAVGFQVLFFTDISLVSLGKEIDCTGRLDQSCAPIWRGHKHINTSTTKKSARVHLLRSVILVFQARTLSTVGWPRLISFQCSFSLCFGLVCEMFPWPLFLAPEAAARRPFPQLLLPPEHNLHFRTALCLAWGYIAHLLIILAFTWVGSISTAFPS